MDRKTPTELQAHMAGTYYTLRLGLAVIGISLPIVLAFTGRALHDVALERSLSQYYLSATRVPFLTTRDLFVGGLFAVGACLYLYKGFSTKENVVLNFAGLFVTLVALLPTAVAPSTYAIIVTLHITFAVLFFICIAYVSLFRSSDTLDLLPSDDDRKKFRRWYLGTGGFMLASPLAAIVLSRTLDPESGHTLIFWVEAFGVWAFAAYWIVKTFEMRRTNAEKRALDAELKRELVPAEAAAPSTRKMDGDTSMADEAPSPRTGTVERIVPA